MYVANIIKGCCVFNGCAREIHACNLLCFNWWTFAIVLYFVVMPQLLYVVMDLFMLFFAICSGGFAGVIFQRCLQPLSLKRNHIDYFKSSFSNPLFQCLYRCFILLMLWNCRVSILGLHGTIYLILVKRTGTQYDHTLFHFHTSTLTMVLH